MPIRTLTATACLAAALAVAAGPARADEPSYKGKTIRLINAGGESGSYAIYTRILARHIGRHIPGQPDIIVDFMPGSGGLKGQNYFANAAPRDGSVVGMPMPSVITAPMLYPKSAKFDPAKFVWIGNLTQLQTGIGVWKATSPAKTLEEAKKVEVILGSSGRTSELSLTPRLLNAVLGTKFKIVEGYKSIGPINQAMERGEVHGRSGGMTAWHPLKPDWFRGEPKVVFLVQLGMSRHPAIPDVPLVTDFAKTEEQRQVLELMSRSTTLTRAVMLPPGAPPELAKALRAAFDATLKDPAFLAEMDKRKMQMVNPMRWQEIETFIADTAKTPPQVIKKFQEIIGIKEG